MSTIIDDMDFLVIDEKNYEICQQGDFAGIFYIIISGACQVTMNGKAIALLGELDFFGENALFTGANGVSKRGATVTTINDEIENVQLLALPRKKFDKLLASGALNEECIVKLKQVAEMRKKKNEEMVVNGSNPSPLVAKQMESMKTSPGQKVTNKQEAAAAPTTSATTGEVKMEERLGEQTTKAFIGGSGSVAATMASDHTSDIETVRLLLKTKVRSINKFSVIFKKIDKEGNGTLSKIAFRHLIQLTVKGNKKLGSSLNVYFEALWVDVCRTCTKKGGGGEVEVDLDTVTNWLFR
jgi:CRP-like cAMP-binding protein